MAPPRPTWRPAEVVGRRTLNDERRWPLNGKSSAKPKIDGRSRRPHPTSVVTGARTGRRIHLYHGVRQQLARGKLAIQPLGPTSSSGPVSSGGPVELSLSGRLQDDQRHVLQAAAHELRIAREQLRQHHGQDSGKTPATTPTGVPATSAPRPASSSAEKLLEASPRGGLGASSGARRTRGRSATQ